MRIVKGSTYRDTLRWATSQCVLRPIDAVSPTAPAILDVPGHGLTHDWYVSIEGHPDIDERAKMKASVVDTDTLKIECLNGVPFRKARPAVLRYNAPVDLTGYSARQQIRDKVGGTVLLTLDSDGVAGEARIIIDEAEGTISRDIPADVTAAIDWKRGVFDLEMYIEVGGVEDVFKIDRDTVTVEEEVTVPEAP